MESDNEIISVTHQKQRIWYTVMFIFVATFVIMLIMVRDDKVQFLLKLIFALFASVFTGLICLLTGFYNAKKVFYKIHNNGIELGVNKRYSPVSHVSILFESILWIGPTPTKLAPAFGKHKVLNWMVRWQVLYPYPYIFFKSWTIIYRQDEDTFAARFYPPELFINKLQDVMDKRGIGHLMK